MITPKTIQATFTIFTQDMYHGISKNSWVTLTFMFEVMTLAPGRGVSHALHVYSAVFCCIGQRGKINIYDFVIYHVMS